MTTEPNPYAPPHASLDPGGPEGCWRAGKEVVLRAGAALPPRCVKCNAPVTAPIKARTYYWHHPALYILALVNLLIYAVVALIVRRRATLAPGLCSAHTRRRRLGLLVGWGGLLAFLGLLVAGVAVDGCGLMLAGGLVLLGALVAAILLARIVIPSRIDAEWVRLKGCGAAFLDSLPDFLG